MALVRRYQKKTLTYTYRPFKTFLFQASFSRIIIDPHSIISRPSVDPEVILSRGPL